MLGFSNKQLIESTKQQIVLVWPQVNQPKQFSTFSETPKSKTIDCFKKTTGCFSLSLKNTLILKDLKYFSFRFNKEWITQINYPNPILNTAATLALHQTHGFRFFKAFDHSWFNNFPLFDEDKSLVTCVGVVWIWSSSCKTKLYAMYNIYGSRLEK